MPLVTKFLLLTTYIVAFAAVSMEHPRQNAKKSLESYEFPTDKISVPSICQMQRINADLRGSNWVPNCRPNGYFSLFQCNRAQECWCSDLLGEKMNEPKPFAEVDCQKPCFLRKTASLFTFDKCDKNGEFQKPGAGKPDIYGGF